MLWIKWKSGAGHVAASILCLSVVLFVHNGATRPTGRAGDRMEICLMRPEERERERETEGPDYKQTKHRYMFWAAMWRTFILIKILILNVL